MTKLKKRPRLPYAPDPQLTAETDVRGTNRYDDVYTEYEVGKVTAVREAGDHTYVVDSQGEARLRLQIWSDDVIRVRFTVGAPGRDFSYARDEYVGPAGATQAELKEQSRGWILTTATVQVSISRKEGRIIIRDRKSKVIAQEFAANFYGRSTLKRGLEQVRIQVKTDKAEAIYGLGDKAGATDLQGTKWTNWNEDSFAFGATREAVYRSIPFYYGLREDHAYGFFLDNSYKSHFDFNSRGDGLTTIWAEGGEFDYFFINGPRLDEVAVRYHELTGVPELPPLWAMGFHQCRWSYYPESRVRELARTFRDKKIPCDAIYLDIDYMDGYRCFTWNKDYFPDPAGLIGDLRRDGFHTVVMIDPGIRVDENYDVYKDGTEQDVWCRRSSGRPMIGPVWPPECVWPDYTDPFVRDWWGPLYEELYVNQGVSGFWNDMNEPAMFKVNSLTFPDDVLHDYDGAPTDHRKAHNVYGMQMTRASYEGLKELQPAKRPFLLGRASFSGGQRYAALWTGDNIASWEHLRIANRQCLRMAISGFSMVGTDIGGFVDEPSPELLTRWLQLAVFHPFMRIHSMGNNVDGAAEVEADEVKKAERKNRQDQEPWVHGKPHTKHNRKAIEMRYQLLPYLYSCFAKHTRSGLPVIRNLFFYDQTDPKCRKYDDQFLYGEDLLVAPVLTEGAKSLTVYLPAGEWYDFWTGERFGGRQKVRVKVKVDRIPVYVRAGAVLPTVAVTQHTGEMHRLDNLELSVFVADRGESSFYWDAGEGYGYAAGQYSERAFTVVRQNGKVTVRQQITGAYNPSFVTAELRFVGLKQPPNQVQVDGQKLTSGVAYGKRAVAVTVPVGFGEVTIE